MCMIYRLKQKLARVVRKNFYLAYHLDYLRYRKLQDPSREPLVVFQMGKVGSSTLANTLNQMDTAQTIYQVHYLTREWIDSAYRLYRDASRIHGRAIVDEHLLASRYLRARMDQPGDRKWRVITLIRDPVARNISAFFQIFPIHYPRVMKRFIADRVPAEDRSREMMSLFLDDFDKHMLPVEWFDRHMKPSFDIDVYDEAFDPDLGYRIYENDRARLLLIRLEDLRQSAGPALKAFMGIEEVALLPANISGDKDYAREYRLFKDHIRLTEHYIDSLYETRYMRHFYSDAEIARLRKKWGQRPAP